MSKILSSISIVSSLTVASRFLGLSRDVLFFTCFGVSLMGDAFILAFTIPNLFRRMLGEGTLTSAFIPVYSEHIREGNSANAQQVLNQVLSRLLLFLFILTLIVSFLSWKISIFEWNYSEKWTNGLYLNSIIFPYVLLICISAILVGALNSHGNFFVGAFSPIILNICMIFGLIFFYFVKSWRDSELAIALCIAVLIGGFFQMIGPYYQLKKSFGWRWKIDFSSSSGLEKIKSLFVVGVFGAAVGQLNIMVSRFLAYSLEDEGSLSYLFLSARLIELPLGVFAISISTVFFPALSSAFSSDQPKDYQKCFARGFRLIFAITLPSAIGLAFLANSILSVLFEWGNFGKEDVEMASNVLFVSCFGLPFYALAAYLVKAFHSQKEMGVPLRAAIISFILNLILSLILMRSFGVFGLAWANVISAIGQTIYLFMKLNFCGLRSLVFDSEYSFRIIVISSGVMLLILWCLRQSAFGEGGKLSTVLELLIMIPLGVLFYGSFLYFFRFPEIKKIFSKIPLFGREKE